MEPTTQLAIVTVVSFLGLAAIPAAALLLVRDIRARRRAARQSDTSRAVIWRPLPDRKSLPRGTSGAIRRVVLDSGLDVQPIAAVLLMLLCGTALGGSLAIAFDHPLPGLAGMMLGMAVGYVYFAICRARRMKALQEQLPDAFDLLMRAVRAGESLDQAIALAAEEVPKPLGVEFQRCARQIDMGLSVASVADGFARRVPLTDAQIFATTLTVHRQAGGNLAMTLERLAQVVRDRLSYRRQFRAASAGGRAAAILISSVGFIAFCVLLIWQPQYLAPLFHERSGNIVLVSIVVLQIVGLTWVAALLRHDD